MVSIWTRRLLIPLSAVMMIGGCGGGGGGGTTGTTGGTSSRTVTGTCSGPGGNGRAAVGNSRQALAIEPIARETVQLGRIAADGVGIDPITGAGAITGDDGTFAIPFDGTVGPGSDLMVFTGAAESPTMAAAVLGSTGNELRPATAATSQYWNALLFGQGDHPADVPLTETIQFFGAAVPVAKSAETGADLEQSAHMCSNALVNSPAVSSSANLTRPPGDRLVVTSVTPNVVEEGDPVTTVVIRGKNFTQTTKVAGNVLWTGGTGVGPECAQGFDNILSNIKDDTLNFVSTTEIRVDIGPFYTPGTYGLHIWEDSGTAADQCASRRKVDFTIRSNDNSTITGITPSSVRYDPDRTAIVPIRINGTGFTADSRLQVTESSAPNYRVSDVSTQSSTLMRATITLSFGSNAQAGTLHLSVSNPAGVSNSEDFSITAGSAPPTDPPALASVSPASVQRGSTVTLTLTGENLVDPSHIILNGVWGSASLSNQSVSGDGKTLTVTGFSVDPNAAVGTHYVYAQSGQSTTNTIPLQVVAP